MHSPSATTPATVPAPTTPVAQVDTPEAAMQRVVQMFNQLQPSDLSRLHEFYTSDAKFKDPFNDVQGVPAIERANIAKAALLYDYLDTTQFYRSPARKEDRSRMNVRFHLRDEKLDEAFLKGAKAAGMDQLKGHRVVGGMRASIYNAVPLAGVQALVDFMNDFAKRHG